MAHCCFVNLGLFRSGTTTLATAAESLKLLVHREFPELSAQDHKRFLYDPANLVSEWWFEKGGLEAMLNMIKRRHFLCDGWVAIIAFLPPEALLELKIKADGVKIVYLATIRDIEETVQSELQHWTIHDLERKACLSPTEREELEQALRFRAEKHRERLVELSKQNGVVHLHLLPLDEVEQWPSLLSSIEGTGFDREQWDMALRKAGKQNANPPLPVEGILLTLRLGKGMGFQKALESVNRLLEGIEKDSLCRYLVVFGIDQDEIETEQAGQLETIVDQRPRVARCIVIENEGRSSDEPFKICRVWHQMAEVAFRDRAGWTADWVVLLGDDITVHSGYHYRATYRAFHDISRRLKCPFGFGCPWWEDLTFPGFPTFPVIGKEHFNIFGGLIPSHRLDSFVNQDLDPYLQRLYLNYGAAPMIDAKLSNHRGGSDDFPARYDRVPALGWREWVGDDVAPISRYLLHETGDIPHIVVLDIVVPSYRIDLEYLTRICSIPVPHYFRTCFIIIVDNPDLLVVRASGVEEKENSPCAKKIDQASRWLEHHLVSSSKSANYCGNNVRVRCNPSNLGASASRNRGLDESAAEYILFLDDDVVPDTAILEKYGEKLQELPDDVCGLVGLVQFPRSRDLSLKHAAVLMSYLTFMFEIASNPMYIKPAWGVTANILFRRSPIRFDTDYAKTGGGEDVDFCLRCCQESGGSLLAAPHAVVHHPFWKGSVLSLSNHFFNWANGDSALFSRFPIHTYRSFPNAVETFVVMIPLWLSCTLYQTVTAILSFLIADVLVDMSKATEFCYRCSVLKYPRPTAFYVIAHILFFFMNLF
jgi:glycosyltransferase involved in cell wall biosynthesis